MRAFILSLAVCGALAVVAPGAVAATVSGELAYCDEGDVCRYFPDPRLEVTFLAAPGESNELDIHPDPNGVRFSDIAPITPGESCTAASETQATCGPPGPAGLVVEVRTGDREDMVQAVFGSVVALGSDDDLGIGTGTISGGPGKDDLSAAFGPASLYGGRGDDSLKGGPEDDLLYGGPGADLVVGGRGADTIAAGAGDDIVRAADGHRDTIRCGRGADRAYVDRRDRVKGCEQARLGSRPR